MKNYFASIAILLQLACTKQEVPASNVTMIYQMTQCADPWMTGNYFNDREGTLRQFLINNQIQVISLRIVENNMGMVCAACNCVGNFKAIVEVPSTQVSAMEAFKFTRQ
jgi:hypothetical protein